MKTAELTGATLDYWVAKAEGVADGLIEKDGRMCRVEDWDPDKMAWRDDLAAWKMWMDYAPSQRWDEGGPIIQRERIGVDCDGGWGGEPDQWFSDFQHPARSDGCQRTHARGPTPLIAAMRAFVASKYGEELPDA